MSTSGQTAVVTGASSGLGAEFARLLAQDGHDVVLVARRRDRLDDLASRLQTDHGIKAHVIAQDLTAPQGAEALVRELEARNLHADYLINNAGAGTTGAFATADLATELAMLTLNITALVHLTRLLLPGMLERDRAEFSLSAPSQASCPGRSWPTTTRRRHS
jgi:short-subunit dehydrogenase